MSVAIKLFKLNDFLFKNKLGMQHECRYPGEIHWFGCLIINVCHKKNIY